MKGKIVKTTNHTPVQIKGYTSTATTLRGLWCRVTNAGQLTTEYKRLELQNGFFAAHKDAGTVFVVTTGADKGFWSKVDNGCV